MKVLVIGSGGREHAIVKSLSQAQSVSEIHVAPGNDGMAKEALCHNLDLKNHEALIQFCLRTEIEFVIIGPEEPLVDGLADRLRERGILVVGPGREAARLEGSKIFAKEFMIAAGVPTAKYVVVSSVLDIERGFSQFSPPYVLKADGLAAGKGVFICKNKEELFEAAKDLFERKTLGLAGENALLEEFKPGWELSYLVLTNGQSHVSLPLAQDHKRLQDDDHGPNTGGMGTIAPLKIDAQLKMDIENKIVAPSIQRLKEEAFVFRGVLFIGIMVTPDGPMVLEYNVRFGDPETQVILPLIDQDTGVLFKNLALGKLDPIALKNIFTCCVIMAADGYPSSPKKNIPIEGPLTKSDVSSYFIHAGTRRVGSQWLTNGGRVLGAVGLGSSRDEARRNSYALTELVRWPGVQLRKDIGAKLKE